MTDLARQFFSHAKALTDTSTRSTKKAITTGDYVAIGEGKPAASGGAATIQRFKQVAVQLNTTMQHVIAIARADQIDDDDNWSAGSIAFNGKDFTLTANMPEKVFVR